MRIGTVNINDETHRTPVGIGFNEFTRKLHHKK
jgi:hypothetical protein